MKLRENYIVSYNETFFLIISDSTGTSKGFPNMKTILNFCESILSTCSPIYFPILSSQTVWQRSKNQFNRIRIKPRAWRKTPGFVLAHGKIDFVSLKMTWRKLIISNIPVWIAVLNEFVYWNGLLSDTLWGNFCEVFFECFFFFRLFVNRKP